MKSKSLFASSLLLAFFCTQLQGQNLDIYVSDAGNFNLPPWQILKFDENGQNGKVFISDHLGWPQDIVFVEAKNWALVANLNDGVISKFDATTGAFIDEFATGIGGPTRMKIGADGLLYVLQWQGNGKVRRYNLDGSFLGDFTLTAVSNAIGMDWDASGNLYISSYNGKFVQKFGPTGTDMGKFVSTNLVGPTNIWFADNGELMVVDYEGNAVKRFDENGAYIGILFSSLPQGEGVDFFPNGDIVIGCGGSHSVRLYDKAGVFKKNIVPNGTLGLITPNAVVFRQKAASQTAEIFKDAIFAVPSVGRSFQLFSPNGVLFCEVHDSSGVLVQKLDLTKGTTWDASNLPDGIYYISSNPTGGTVFRQKIVVQK